MSSLFSFRLFYHNTAYVVNIIPALRKYFVIINYIFCSSKSQPLKLSFFQLSSAFFIVTGLLKNHIIRFYPQLCDDILVFNRYLFIPYIAKIFYCLHKITEAGLMPRLLAYRYYCNNQAISFFLRTITAKDADATTVSTTSITGSTSPEPVDEELAGE